jgi:thioesterase domain-containing protein
LPEFMIPSRLVILDKMPMTTSGKVDRRALPKPQDQWDDTREIVSARNDLEFAILPIFQKILGVQSLGVRDDFFELGGHSLLAARLLSEIKHVTGRSIPLSAMLQAATVESLAGLIASEEGPLLDSVATQIQQGEKDFVPLFAVVIPGFETIGYAALARHVGPQQPFYTLQGKQLPAGAPPFIRTEQESLAKEYIAAMRSVQPEGPYCFIAMCDDAVICEEMILQLERAGLKVGFFAILDTWVVQNSMVRWKWKIDYYATRLRRMGQLPPSDWFTEGWHILGRKLGTKEEPAQSCERPTWGQAYWPGPGFQPPTFHAPVVLFKRPRQPFFYVTDRQMGWGQRSLGGVELHEIDLDHDNLLREPHIRTVGKILAARLRIPSKRLV